MTENHPLGNAKTHNNEFSASLEEGLFYGGGLEDNCSVPIWAVDVPMSRLEEVMGCVSHFFSGDSEGRLSVLSAKPTVSGFRPDMIRLRREINPYDYGLRYIGIVRQRAVYFGNRLSEDVVVYGSLHELGDEYCNVADYARQNGGHLPSYAQRKGMIPAGTRWNLSIASKVEFQSGAIGKEVLPDGSFSRFLWSIQD